MREANVQLCSYDDDNDQPLRKHFISFRRLTIEAPLSLSNAFTYIIQAKGFLNEPFDVQNILQDVDRFIFYLQALESAINELICS